MQDWNTWYRFVEAARVNHLPIALHLDHHEEYDDICRKVRAGIRSVMIDGSHFAFEQNIEAVSRVVKYCQNYDVSVEAELAIRGQEDDLVVDSKDSFYTDPMAAKEYITRTGIDSLAVAIDPPMAYIMVNLTLILSV